MKLWNREELYADVWEKPLTSLVPKYGVSAVAIGKTCRKLQGATAWSWLLGKKGARPVPSHASPCPG
jgi:hypothetical protein